MWLLTQTLCLALALSYATPHHGKEDEHTMADAPHPHKHDHGPHDPHGPHDSVPDRCKGIEFDAVAVNENGVPYFFKGHHIFKGFHGPAELGNKSFAELDDHHSLGHVDAAFLMHDEDAPTDHDHLFLFLDNKVFSYYNHTLEKGYPKDISEVFPGIPNHLDAAIKCPKGDCPEDSVIFFKGNKIYHFHVKTKKVDEKVFKGMPNCTAAIHFIGHYYCFHGHQFSKFDPLTGNVHGKYPKNTLNYFMKCSKYGNESDPVEREQCSHVHLDAITSDDAGNIYAFRGHHFIQQDANKDKLHTDAIEKSFKELHSDVDAVFSYQQYFHMIKDDKVFVYTTGEPHTLQEGYPKSLKEVLGIDGHVDAAFVCADHHIVHIIKGQELYNVDLKASPHKAVKEGHLSLFKHVDAGMCNSKGVTIVAGNNYYHFDSVKVMSTARAIPVPHKVSVGLFGCDH